MGSIDTNSDGINAHVSKKKGTLSLCCDCHRSSDENLSKILYRLIVIIEIQRIGFFYFLEYLSISADPYVV